MSDDEIEKFLSPLEVENAELSKANFQLTQERDSLMKLLKDIIKILQDKAYGFNGAMKLYVDTVIGNITKFLEKEGIIKQNEEDIDTKGKKY